MKNLKTVGIVLVVLGLLVEFKTHANLSRDYRHLRMKSDITDRLFDSIQQRRTFEGHITQFQTARANFLTTIANLGDSAIYNEKSILEEDENCMIRSATHAKSSAIDTADESYATFLVNQADYLSHGPTKIRSKEKFAGF